MELNMINLKEFTNDYTSRTIANYNTIYNAYLNITFPTSETI